MKAAEPLKYSSTAAESSDSQSRTGDVLDALPGGDPQGVLDPRRQLVDQRQEAGPFPEGFGHDGPVVDLVQAQRHAVAPVGALDPTRPEELGVALLGQLALQRRRDVEQVGHSQTGEALAKHRIGNRVEELVRAQVVLERRRDRVGEPGILLVQTCAGMARTWGTRRSRRVRTSLDMRILGGRGLVPDHVVSPNKTGAVWVASVLVRPSVASFMDTSVRGRSRPSTESGGVPGRRPDRARGVVRTDHGGVCPDGPSQQPGKPGSSGRGRLPATSTRRRWTRIRRWRVSPWPRRAS